MDAGLASDVVRDLLAQSKGSQDRTSSLPAQLRKGLLARATKVLLHTVAERRPSIIVMDDCQWLDAPSAAIIEEAIADLDGIPLGWILLHRPGWTPPPTWPVGTQISLEPLSVEAGEELARSLLGPSAGANAIKFVVDRAEGNPLFLVELCSAMADQDTAASPRDGTSISARPEPRYLTEQLGSLILSRIDALDERARRVVHIAAVLGHAFPATLLRSVLGRGDWGAVLGRLEEHGILVRDSRARGDGRRATWTWHFRHPLVQETVYASLLSATRSSLHRTAGEALESMTDAAVADRLALLALHFGRGDDRDRAIHYLTAAGDRARILYLNREAIHYYEDALSRLNTSEADLQRRGEIMAALGAAFEVLAEYDAALESLQAAIKLETRLEVQADLWRQVSEIHRRRGMYAAADDDLTRAEQCSTGTRNPLALARVRIARSMLAWARGAYAEARQFGTEAITLLDNVEGASLDQASAFRCIGIAAAREDDLPVASLAFTRALEAARTGQDGLLSATISVNLGTLLHLQGHTQEALRRYAEALEFYERIGAKRGIALACINLGDLYWRDGRGDWSEANAHWLRARRLYEEIGDQHGLALTLRNLGEAHLKLGELELVSPLLSRARELADQLEDTEMRSGIDRELARLDSVRGALLAA